MSEVLQGGCLCEAVRYELQPPFLRFMHCHCSRCRKGTGTGHGSNLALDPAQFRWLKGEENISRYELPAAQSFGKWFCRTCGSPVPRVARNRPFMVIPAGSLDAPPPVMPGAHIFWASRMPWSCGSSGLPVHEEYPPNL